MEPLEKKSTQLLSPRLVLGLFLVGAGALLVLDRLGIFDADPLWEYWPVILIVLGLLKLFGPASHNRGGGVVLLGIGSWFLIDNLTTIDLDFGDIFPLVVLLIGVSLVVGALSSPRPPRGGADGGATVDGLAILGGIARTNNSQSFRGGSATAIAGSCEIDLRQAAITGGEAVIDTFAWWGGIEILVPETWTVDLRGTAILGSFEDLTRPPVGGSTQRLVIKGMAIMGGVEIKNHKRDR
jgi:hypothetical protein